MVAGGIGIGGARAGFARFLTDTVEVLRRTETPDGEGGVNVGPAVVATVAGNIVAETSQPQEVQAGGRTVGVVTYTEYLAYGTDVRPNDLLRRGTDTFEVVDDTAAESDGLATVVTVKRIR